MEKEKVEKGFKWGLAALVLGAGFFIGMFLITSIVTLGIAAVLGIAFYNGIPVFAHYAAQMQVRGFLFLANQNPIEDLVLTFQRQYKRLEKAAQAVAEFGRATKDYGDKLDGFKQRRPTRAAEFQETYNKMAFVYQKQLASLTAGKQELANFQEVIAEATDVWDMTKAQQKAQSLLKRFTRPDPMEAIRKQTALNAVTSSLNQSMADLDVAMAMDYNTIDVVANEVKTAPPAIELKSEADVLQMPLITVKEVVNVSNSR